MIPVGGVRMPGSNGQRCGAIYFVVWAMVH